MTPDVQGRVVGAEHRLRQLVSDMNDIWASSFHESAPDAPIDLYAVDADIAYMYLSPAELHRYGALLRHEALAKSQSDAELMLLETKLVEFLGSLIFFGMQPDCPPLIIGPHAIELHNKATHVIDEAMRKQQDWTLLLQDLADRKEQTTALSRARLGGAIESLTQDCAEGGVDAAITGLFEDIQESLRGGGALGQLFRFDMLTVANRLQHLDRLVLHDANGAQVGLPSPYLSEGKLELRAGKLAARLLTKMTLLDTIHGPTRVQARESDAHVLAHLAWLNEQLAAGDHYLHTKTGRRQVRRVLLISGSRLLGRAIQAAKLTELDACLFSPLSMLGHRSMGDYVPAMAGDTSPSTDQAAGIRTSALINFLDAMRQTLALAMATKNEDAIRDAFAEVQRRHADLVANWQERQLLDKQTRPDAVGAAIRELEQAGGSIEKLAEFVQRTTATSWQAFARSIAQLALSRDNSPYHVESSLPPLELAGYPIAQELIGQLLRFPYGVHSPVEATSPMNGAMRAKLVQEDPSLFTEFLCYGVWTLGHTLLDTALGCVELALSIVGDESMGPARSRERIEACYLRAYLIKRRMRSVEDFDRALECVAFDATALHAPYDLLVQGERFSIASHRYYFETFGTGRRPPARHDQARAALLYGEGMALLGALRRRYDGPPTYPGEYLRHQVLVNLVQLALLCKFGFTAKDHLPNSVFSASDPDPALDGLEPSFQQVASDLIALQDSLLCSATGALPQPSTMSSAVTVVAGLVWMPRRGEPYDRTPFEVRKQGDFEARRLAFLERVAAYKHPEALVH